VASSSFDRLRMTPGGRLRMTPGDSPHHDAGR
jgi:hypothetical protein